MCTKQGDIIRDKYLKNANIMCFTETYIAETSPVYVVGYEKRDLIAHFPNLHSNVYIYLWTHSSYGVFFHHPATLATSGVGGANVYASLWRLTTRRDRRLAQACNVGSVK